MWEYLEAQGVLERGDDEIKAAKKEYRRLYNRHLKRKLRQERKEYHPLFSREENQLLEKEAALHDKSVTQLIHDTSLAYLRQEFVIPNPGQVAELEVLLAKAYSEIQRAANIVDEKPRLSLLEMMRTVEKMEKLIRGFFYEPKLVLDSVKNSIEKDDEFKNQLLAIIQQDNDY